MATRIETDTMGAVEVPDDVYWGAQTQRGLEHFAIGSERLPPVFHRAYGLLKQAAAEANAALGVLDAGRAAWIARAAGEVAEGAFDASFPLSIWHSGSGTQTNMNLNEVIANRANELAGAARGAKAPVHPNDHVNRGQSTNDGFPTAMHLAAELALRDRLAPALDALLVTLDGLSQAHRHLVKMGRTHLQDATPLTLGQEIGGWASQLRLSRASLEAGGGRRRQLAIGGTAVGTGLNAHPDFAGEVVRRLGEKTGIAFTSAPDKFAALAGHEAMVELSGALANLAASLLKLANDVRWMASGPRGGLAEIRIPANEPGSSIMPGKVNPSQAEALVMVCLQVQGHHATILAAAGQGSFELNVCKPLIAWAALNSIALLADALTSFDRHCLSGLEPDEAVLAEGVRRSLMLVTALAPHIGYDEAARIAKKAHADATSLREAALALGSVTAEDFDAWMRVEDMLGPRGGGR
jgi:fumarate hydratase class II